MHDASATPAPSPQRIPWRTRPPTLPVREAFERLAVDARCSAWRRGNSVTLLADGAHTFEAMFAAIEAARHSIHLETYVLESAGPGERLAQLLARKCAEGVRVRVLFDSVGSIGTDRAYFAALEQSGVAVREFNPVRPWHKRFRWVRWVFNRRTHRKLLVIDDAVAFIGGVNISTVYSSGSAVSRDRNGAAASAREQRPWRDTHAQVRGPIVHDLQALFHAHWVEQGGETASAEFRDVCQTPSVAGGGVPVALAASAAGSRRNPLYRAMLATIAAATRSVLITTPYFVPTRRMVRALKRAAQRGVRVAVMVPSESDSWTAWHAGRSRYGDLLAAGVEIHEHLPSMLHAKTVAIDDIWCSIGSSNMDWRSLLHNAEANIIALDGRCALELRVQFERDRGECRAITLDAWSLRPWTHRVCERLVRPFHYFL